MNEILLEFHELKEIANYLKIAVRKGNTTSPKIQAVVSLMESGRNPVCKISVEEKK